MPQKSRLTASKPENSGEVKPHHLPVVKKQLVKAAFAVKGHNGDTFFIRGKRMRKPSKPALNTDDPKKYFIFWNHDVPQLLWYKYKRKRLRIKVYDDINRYKGDERETYARLRLQVWEHALFVENYNPFDDELAKLLELTEERQELIADITKVKELTDEQKRRLTPLNKALKLFIASRQERTKNKNSISTFRVTMTWFEKYFKERGLEDMPISQVKRMQVADALLKAKASKGWENTTYNNEYGVLINLFNWLAKEEYIDHNPIVGKIEKMPESKHKNRWFDKDVKASVKKALLDAQELTVYRVMQFTYYLLIRSKTELMKLKAGDIDRTLKRIRFSAELSKNNTEAFRDYPAEFEQVLDEINFDAIPADWYIFGKKGQPSPVKCHKDFFADRWRPIREKLGLPDDYTIYGMKHTRIVHELMKKTDGYDISYMARHLDTKSTKEYQRDYDITLNNVYKPEDLTF